MAWADDPVVSDEPRPLKKPLNAGERVAAQRLSFSPEEQAYDAKTEAWLRDRPFLAAEREEWLKKAPDEETRRAMLDEDQKSIPAPTGDGGQPAWMSDPEVSAGSRGEPPKNLKIGRESFKEDLRETLQQAGWLNRNIAAAGTALSNPALRLAQVAGGGLSQGGQDLVEANRVMAEEGPAGAIAGNIGLFAIPGGAAARGATTAAGRVLPRVLAPAAGAAATGAGLAAATTPTLPGESEFTAPAYGAIGGVAGDVGARVASRIAQPVIQSQAVQDLLKRGIVPTIGQASGPRSFVNSVEQRLASLPVIGYFMKGGRERAAAEYNLDRLRASVPPADRARIDQVGRAGIEKAEGIVDDSYDAIYSRIPKPVGRDSAFDTAVKDIPNRAGINLPDSQLKQFDRTIKDLVESRMKGKVDANVLREIHNDIGQEARDFLRSTSVQEQRLGRAFQQAKQEFRDMVSRQSGGDFKAAMDDLDKIYANLQVAKRASEYAGSKEGIFSAERYATAAKRGPKDTRALSKTAADVLGGTEPDSGTAGRLLLPLAMAGAAGGNESYGGPGWLSAALLAPALYSRAGQRYMLGNLIPGQAALGAGLRSTAPYATVAGETLIPKR